MALQSRGQEVTIQLILDGVLQARSFAKVEDFDHTPRTDLSDNSFLGEATDEPDIQHHGHDFSFTVREAGGEVLDTLTKIVAAEEASLPHPSVSVVVITRYRDPAIPAKTEVFERAVLKLAKRGFGGRKEYVKNSFEGKCRKVTVI